MPKNSFQIPTHKEDGIEKGNLADKEDSVAISSSTSGQDDEDDVLLPGFRFHPTDEELVGFYLRRKVNMKPISIELIKQVDIYKFDPWDLPKPRSVGDKEGYFFCRRIRKYRNSVRPNRVTESGFWKATGIDKPVYSVEGERIGLKKTLVYYRRSAGKGTNSNWMMNEFRLLMNDDNSNYNASSADEEAEVWTLCRVFKRNVRRRMTSTPEWRELPNTLEPLDTSSIDTHPTVVDSNSRDTDLQQCDKNQVEPWALTSSSQPSSSSMGSSDTLLSPYWNELFTTNGDWDELRSVVDFSFNRSNLL